MDYEEAKRYVKMIQQGAKMKLGLDTVQSLLEHLGNPHHHLSVIHVAGTNGKGSTAAFIEAVLAETGKSIGRFVSPAVFDERETIRYRDAHTPTRYISKEEYARYMGQIRDAIDKMQEKGERTPTEFEIETAMAFLAFQDWKCDVVLLETGMGGRFDATNVISQPICVVITPIAMDHTKFLGDTIEQIAMEKAGIIKKGVPVVTCQEKEAVRECLQQVCHEKDAEIWFVEKDGIDIHSLGRDGIQFSYLNHRNVKIGMAGRYQVENACLALECLNRLKTWCHISDRAVLHGMAKAAWQGRFQILDTDPVMVLDGAHNPNGMDAFCESAGAYFPYQKKIGIMGVFADKAYGEISRRAARVFDVVYTVTPPSERGLSAVELANCLNEDGVFSLPCETMAHALKYAREEAKNQDGVIFVVGSLSILKEAMTAF